MRRFLIFVITSLFFNISYCQLVNDNSNGNVNVIQTCASSLSLNPNAQSMGIGNIGVVASSEYYETGLTQNPALLSRNEKVAGLKISYMPWLKNLQPGMYLANIGLYTSINEKMSIGFTFNYFSYGSIVFTDYLGNSINTFNPKEFYGDLKYAYSINPNLSLGMGLKYIHSDMTGGMFMGGVETHPGRVLAGDIGIDYHREIKNNEDKFWRYDIGASITNIGNKINYDNINMDFIPITLRIGAMLTFTKKINNDLSYCIDMAYQMEKLLVPTPPIYSYDSIDNYGNYIIVAGMNPDVSVPQGMIQSFYDAPEGGKEELREIIHIIGIENRFIYKNDYSFSIRMGHFNEHRLKGNRKFFLYGFGVRYKYIYIDFSKLLAYMDSNHNYQLENKYNPRTIWNITLGLKHDFN